MFVMVTVGIVVLLEEYSRFTRWCMSVTKTILSKNGRFLRILSEHSWFPALSVNGWLPTLSIHCWLPTLSIHCWFTTLSVYSWFTALSKYSWFAALSKHSWFIGLSKYSRLASGLSKLMNFISIE